MVDYVKHWSERAELPRKRLVGWLGVGASKFYQWQDRYGQANEHNGAGDIERTDLRLAQARAEVECQRPLERAEAERDEHDARRRERESRGP